MGSTNSAPTRVRRSLLIAAALLLVLLAAAAPAHAVDLGISDSDAATISEPLWDGLHVSRARIVVPYDVATPSGPAGMTRQQTLETYLANAAARGVSVLVTFGPSADIRAPGTNDPVAPTAEQFAAAFQAFRQRWPQVTTFAPWNEPNNPDTSQYPLSQNPQLAADYWLRAETICPSCTILAGDFAGIADDDAYVDAYQAELGAARPTVWSFHAHGDINSFQATGPDDARVSRYYLSKFQGQWANSQVWIDEVGARYRDANDFVWGDASQAQATEFLLGLASLDPRITAIYYYNFSNQCSQPSTCAIQDRGLVSPTPFNGQPPDDDAANRPRGAYQVIANRGPVIPPAAPVPPVVSITSPGQSAFLKTHTPAFSGAAAVGGRAQPLVTLQIFTGTGATESTVPVQTLTSPVSAAGGAWAATASAPLPDGTYTAEASQVGNPSSAGISQDVVFTIDTVKPTVTITGGPDTLTGARTAKLTFEASEPGATFRCAVDGARSVPCTSPLSLTKLKVGTHTLAVRAIDAAGNVSQKVARRKWRVVSLATALAARTGSLATATTTGLPLAASCQDACKLGARLYLPASTAAALGIKGRGVSKHDPGRPSGKGWLMVASGAISRTKAGSPTVALKLRAGAALAGAHSVSLRLGLQLTAHGTKPVAVARTVTLVRSGALRSVIDKGLLATVVCSSACTSKATQYVTRDLAMAIKAPGHSASGGGKTGLPKGGLYVALGTKSVTRRSGGSTDVTLPVPKAVAKKLGARKSAALRVVGLASGPGSPKQALGWPLLLPR